MKEYVGFEKLQVWSLKEREISFHRHYSQVHSDLDLLYALESHIWVKSLIKDYYYLFEIIQLCANYLYNIRIHDEWNY